MLFNVFPVFILGLVVACGPITHSQRQPNFGFHFEYGACLKDSFDTRSSIFTHAMGPSEPSNTISLAISDEQMEAIYQKIVAIGFFNYPDSFVSTPLDTFKGYVRPAVTYYLQVQNGDTVKAVSWTDNIWPAAKKSDNLRQLFQMIVAILEEHPEINQLPTPSGGGCIPSPTDTPQPAPTPTHTPTPALTLPPARTLTSTTPPITTLPALPQAIGSNICPDTQPSILMPGRLGRVSNESSDSIRVRVEAGFQAEQVGLLPPGEYFDVIDGPKCVDSVAWFQVNAENGLQGWMAEGSPDEYWVQPIVSDARNVNGPTIALQGLIFSLPDEIGNIVRIADIPYDPKTKTPPYSLARLAEYPLQNGDPVIYVYSVEEYLYYRSNRRNDLEQVRNSINSLMKTPQKNISLISLMDSLVIGDTYLVQAGSFASGLGYHAIAILSPSDGSRAPKPYYVFFGFSSDMKYFVFAKLDVQLAFGQLAQATANDFKPGVHLLDQIFGLSIAPNNLSQGGGEITACPGAPEIKLKPGGWARVSGNPPLPSRIRSQPGSSGEVIGQVQPGENVLVVDGPRCANGYTWWYVRSPDGLEGWAAEGDAAGYWLVRTTVTPTPIPLTLSIRARIDGLSRLIIQENTVHWFHVSAAAPGRWIPAPTFINEVAWNPDWPDVPDSQNRDCGCSSSSYQGIPSIARYPPIILEIIQARGKVAIVQQPSQSNDYTLIVEFDDFTPPDTYGDEWYEIKLKATGG